MEQIAQHTAKGERRDLRTVQAAYIRTRRRKLRPKKRTGATEAASFDVVCSERQGGRVVQRFLAGLGSLKHGGRDESYNRKLFIRGALIRLREAQFPPDLERTLLADFARKAAVTEQDIAAVREFLAFRERCVGATGPIPAEKADLERLAKAMSAAGPPIG